MQITDKPERDPVAELHVADAYLRWALLAAEEVVGERGLQVVLRGAGLERFAGNYPPEEFTFDSGITFADYTNLNAGLLEFFGRAGKSMTLRIGRLSSQHAVKKQGALFNVAATLAAKVMPYPTQIKIGMENVQKGFNKLAAEVGDDYGLSLEDRGDTLAYIAVGCPSCAGKQSDEPMCWSWVGTLKEAIQWLTGKEFEVRETECRALGARACVWEIGKKPIE